MFPVRRLMAQICLSLIILLAISSVVHAEESAQDLIQKGDTYFRSNSADQAIASYSEAISVAPNSPTAYSKRGITYLLAKHDPESALSDLSKSIELGSTSAFTYFYRGTLYFQREFFDPAIKDFTKAIEYKPDFADAYSYRGLTYLRKGTPALAVTDLTKSIELNTYDPYADYINRGAAYKSLGLIDLAIADFSKAIQMKPQGAEGYISRGNSYMLAGKPLSAADDYNYVIRLKPNEPSTYNYLSYAFEDADCFDKAIEANDNYLNKVSSLNNPSVNDANTRVKYLQDLKAALTSAKEKKTKLPPSTTAVDGSVVNSIERQAIVSGVSLMEAYNSKDLNKVRAVQLETRYLPDDQINKFLGNSKDWTLQAVEVLSSTETRITARMVFSRETSNQNYLGRNFSYTIHLATLCFMDGQWRFIRLPKERGLDLFSTMQVAEKSAKRFGVDDLSKWTGLSK
ncbi:MAG TPA: tetratricopeptide repeat protein [Methylomusa anaerophila]|uniref:TPR repeat-containing protein YrrB n=1 Tax=Methylomusa anaerophila TaxID=1930071 RepID=A0A348AQL8_9FIRM|nr:tetratricopeptide repeat protein [Methylomusa anaerophila]BBB93366.1 TPR repeat-containing protein YrrB [Methylomusa anaerophila]HML90313.1 tetratricopeptide repeat protein [Methylomusa anaerophila]